MAQDGRALRALLDGLAELYEPNGAAAYPARAVAVTMRLLPVDSCSYNQIGFIPGPAGDLVPGRVAYWVDPPGVGEFPDGGRLFQQHLPEHPVLAYHRATGDGRARRISDFLSDRQFRSLGLYSDFYRHAGVRYQTAITLHGPAGGLIGIALNRESRDFRDEELELLDLLRPHVGRAARTAALLSAPASGALRTADGRAILTSRQTRILELVGDGLSDRAIARLLRISTRTVHAHLQHIYRLLDVTSRTEALAHLRALSLARAPAGGSSPGGSSPGDRGLRPGSVPPAPPTPVELVSK